MGTTSPADGADARSGGAALEVFERETGFDYWNRYAAVNDEFIPIHMYDEAGQAAGYPAAFGMGNLTWAYFHLALHRWFGEECRIVSLDTQFRSAVVRGTRLAIRGSVTSEREEEGRRLVEVELLAENQEGTALAPARATVEVDSLPK